MSEFGTREALTRSESPDLRELGGDRHFGADDLLIVDEICDKFESAFRLRLPPPDIEALVSASRQDLQETVRQELLAIATHWEQQLNSSSESGIGKADSASMPNDDIYSQLATQFSLDSRLGSGATGEVWKATDRRTGELVAIKFPHLRLFHSLSSLIRFCREARWQTRLRHPRIGASEEVVMAGELPVLVARFIDGVTLRKFLDQNRLSVDQAVELALQLAEGLEYAHTMGIVHRDLKPANIILERLPDGTVEPSRPVIIDFGLAISEGDYSVTSENQTLGTPYYMSPEQASGGSHAAGVPSDIYSLGVILFEAISSRLPIEAQGRSTLIRNVIHEQPAPLSKYYDGVPEDIEQICSTCLRKEPEDRYQSAREFAEDLRRWRRQETILMHRANAYSRLKAWAKKHPAILTSIFSLFAVALMTFLLVVRESYITRLHFAYANETRSLDAAKQSQAKLQSYLIAYRMGRIGNQLANNNPEHAKSLLDECATSQRTWEWRYYNRLLHRYLYELKHETNDQEGRWSVRATATTTDGSTLFSASRSGSLLRWNLNRPDSPPIIVDQQPDGIIDVACSPNNKSICYGTNQGLAFLKQIIDESPPVCVLTMDSRAIHAVRFSPDGRYIAIGGGKSLREDHSPEVGFLVVLDLSSGKEAYREVDLIHSIVDLDWHPDGSQLLGAGGTASLHYESRRSPGAVLLWNTKTWQQLTPISVTGALTDVAWSPIELDRFATCSWDGRRTIWSCSTKEPIHHLPQLACGATVSCFSPDGTVLVTASEDGQCSFWRVSDASLITSNHAHTQAVSSLAFIQGNRLVTSGFDERIRFWDASPEPEPSIDLRSWGDVQCTTQYRDVLFLGVNDPITSRGKILAIDLSSRLSLDNINEVFNFPCEVMSIAAATNADCDSMMAVVLGNETLQHFDICCSGKNPSHNVDLKPRNKPIALPFRFVDSSVSDRLKSCRVSGTTYLSSPSYATINSPKTRNQTVIWSYSEKDGEFGQCEDSNLGTGRAFAASSDGRFLATSSDAEITTIWETDPVTKCIDLYGHNRVVSEICFQNNGSLMATGSWDNDVIVWNPARNQKLQKLLGHRGGVNAIVFHPTESRIMSGSSDRTIRVWDIATGLETATLVGHRSSVIELFFDTKGESLFSLDDSDQLRCW